MPVHFRERKHPKPDPNQVLLKLNEEFGLSYQEIDIGPLNKYKFPWNFSEAFKISGKDIPLSVHARLKCQNCGLFNRGTLCPPRLGNTYSYFATLKKSREWLDRSFAVYIFIWKNDGTKPWLVDWDNISHIRFEKRTGRRLKGVEHASAKAITKFMKKLEDDWNIVSNKGSNMSALIPGHCDVCSHYCPLRNFPNAVCKKGGMPSLEAIGVDVYTLLRSLDVNYHYPVMDDGYLTQVTAIVEQKKNPIVVIKHGNRSRT